MTNAEIAAKGMQVAGALLLSSSLLGPKRLYNCETAIRRFLSPVAMIEALTKRLTPVYQCIRKLLHSPLVVVFLVVGLILAGWRFFVVLQVTRGTSIPTITGQQVPIPEGIWGLLTRVLIVGEAIVDIVLYIIFWPILLIGTATLVDSLAGGASRVLATLGFLVCWLPTLVLYVAIAILLSPFIILDRAAVRLRLRSTLGFIGLIITIIGILIAT